MRQYAAAVVDAERLIGNRVVAELDSFITAQFPEASHLSARNPFLTSLIFRASRLYSE